MKPKISVVIPVKNRADLIPETIQSFLDQNFDNFEIIVVNDHSEDNIAEVIAKFNDSRIKFFDLPSKLGSGKVCARNFGNIMARGKIIAVCDSDDLAKGEKLRKIDEVFRQNPDAGIFYSDGEVKDEILSTTRDRKLKWSPFDLKRLLKENYIAHSSMAYRKEIAMSFPYNPFFIRSEDYELLLRLAKNKIKFMGVADKLFIQKVHEGRESQSREGQDYFSEIARQIHFPQNSNSLEINIDFLEDK